MHLSQRLASQFTDIITHGDFAIGTSFKAQLCGVSWQKATEKVGNHNTIAALIFHIHYYTAGILKVLQGGMLEIRDKYSFDMPPIQSQQGWEKLLHIFFADATALADAISHISDEKLQAPFADGTYGDYFKNITSMMQHMYYHLGQIVLLKKLLNIS